MRKLTLEEIAPYLPYGLKGKCGIKFFEICGASFNQKISFRVKQYGQTISYGNGLKPILCPMSEFEKVAAGVLMKKFKMTIQQVQEVWNLIQGDIKLEDISLGTYLAMCRNNLDFNGLIEADLAIIDTP